MDKMIKKSFLDYHKFKKYLINMKTKIEMINI